MLIGHGGNIKEICKLYGISEVLDFSTNVNPLGYPEGLKDFLFDDFESIKSYPDIKNENLRENIASSFGKNKGNIILGNGSTELLYLITRVLKPSRGFVFTPSYSDYNDSLVYASVPVREIQLSEENDFLIDLNILSKVINENDIVFIGNPNNPTSKTVERNVLFKIINDNPSSYFVIDESFNGFLEDWKEKTLLLEKQYGDSFPDNLIVLQSLTKLYAIPGIRIGMAAASENTIRRIGAFSEPWSVNSFALKAMEYIIGQKEYRRETRRLVYREREYLYYNINAINGLKAYYPYSNFLLVKIGTPNITATILKDTLLRKHKIYIRSCSNFSGLGDSYFRIAVLEREKNNQLIHALSCIDFN